MDEYEKGQTGACRSGHDFRPKNVRLVNNHSIIPEKTVFLFHNKYLDWKNNHMNKGKFDAQEE
ncbi:MAG: hypothetical protein ABW094_12020 [Candidatus Thiodiazotropha sp.]